MKDLLRFEFRRILRLKSTYICLAVSFGVFFVGLLLDCLLASYDTSTEQNAARYAVSALSSSVFPLIMGVFTAIFVNDDVTNHTLKNIYGRGFTRIKVYFAKYIASAVTVLVMATLCVLFAFVSALEFSSGTMEPNGNVPLNLLAQAVMLLAYHAMFFSVDVMSGKLSISLSFNLIGLTIISTLLSLIDMLTSSEKLSIGDFWLETLFGNLSDGSTGGSLLAKVFVSGAVYIVVFTFCGCLKNRKKEV